MGLLEDLKEKLRMLTAAPVPFDPARFNDPVAAQTSWTPARPGGTNFRTHRLIAAAPTRMEFRPSFGAILFSQVFFLPGLAIFVAITVSWLPGSGGRFDPGLLIPLLIGLVFMIVGASLFRSLRTPVVFEKGRGVFWKGRKGPDEAIDTRSAGTFVRLEQVHALQVIAEHVSGKNSYYSYELNLVLQDGKRVPVIDHGNLARIREDAKMLGLFLGKPLWDATTQP